MKTAKCMVLVCLLGIPACVDHRPQTPSPAEEGATQIRVGTYDSRAVAIAYCDSDRHKAEEQRLKDALDTARQSGDAAQIRQADRALWESRKQMHRQAFSTYPVDAILGQFAQEIDRVKQEANLAVLISKWDAKTLNTYKRAERVDVTERLVHSLTSDERRIRHAMEIVRIKPIPPAEYEGLLKKEAGEHY